jgi:hypothetical protein
MDILDSIFNFIVSNFFYDFRSSILTISAIFLAVFLNKLCKDKGDNLVKTLRYLLETCMSFAVLVIMF